MHRFFPDNNCVFDTQYSFIQFNFQFIRFNLNLTIHLMIVKVVVENIGCITFFISWRINSITAKINKHTLLELWITSRYKNTKKIHLLGIEIEILIFFDIFIQIYWKYLVLYALISIFNELRVYMHFSFSLVKWRKFGTNQLKLSNKNVKSIQLVTQISSLQVTQSFE